LTDAIELIMAILECQDFIVEPLLHDFFIGDLMLNLLVSLYKIKVCLSYFDELFEVGNVSFVWLWKLYIRSVP